MTDDERQMYANQLRWGLISQSEHDYHCNPAAYKAWNLERINRYAQRHAEVQAQVEEYHRYQKASQPQRRRQQPAPAPAKPPNPWKKPRDETGKKPGFKRAKHPRQFQQSTWINTTWEQEPYQLADIGGATGKQLREFTRLPTSEDLSQINPESLRTHRIWGRLAEWSERE